MTRHKQELRARAEELRRQGWSVPAIGLEIGVVRRYIGDEYRGCLIVSVASATSLLWRIEGIMSRLISDS